VGDYATQALISAILSRAFPDDPIVGEEDTKDLRKESAADLRNRIVSLTTKALSAELGIGENVEWGIGPGHTRTSTELLDAIDRGNYYGGSTGRLSIYPSGLGNGLTRVAGVGMWTIDPIDGTKCFLMGEQYAVCVSLVVDAQVQLGVIGCPNLPIDPADPDCKRGCIFVAVKGQGAQQVCLSL